MLLKKDEIVCRKCKAILYNIPLYLDRFHINIDEGWEGKRQEWLTGGLQWKCPLCNTLNEEDIKLLLGEDAYISIIANEYLGYSTEIVSYKK